MSDATWDLVDPTGGAGRTGRRQLAARPPDLDGRVLGLLDNGKGNAGPLLDDLAEELGRRFQLAGVVRIRKPVFSRPAPDELIAQLAEGCGAVVTAIGD